MTGVPTSGFLFYKSVQVGAGLLRTLRCVPCRHCAAAHAGVLQLTLQCWPWGKARPGGGTDRHALRAPNREPALLPPGNSPTAIHPLIQHSLQHTIHSAFTATSLQHQHFLVQAANAEAERMDKLDGY